MATDDRVSWVDKRIASSLHAKVALSACPEGTIRSLYEFFERVDLRNLYVCLDSSGTYPLLSYDPPVHLSEKQRISQSSRASMSGNTQAQGQSQSHAQLQQQKAEQARTQQTLLQAQRILPSQQQQAQSVQVPDIAHGDATQTGAQSKLKLSDGQGDSGDVQLPLASGAGADKAVQDEVAHPSPDSKVLVFRKRIGVASVSSSNISDTVLVSEMFATPWKELWLLSREVYLPMLQRISEQHSVFQQAQPQQSLQQSTNLAQQLVHASTPTSVTAPSEAKKILESHLRLLSTIQVTDGYIKGYVVLPLPVVAANASEMLAKTLDLERPTSQGSRRDSHSRRRSKHALATKQTVPQLQRDYVHLLETSVVTWTKLIRTLLKVDTTADPFKITKLCGPRVEVQLARTQAANFDAVVSQLQQPEVQRVLYDLQLAESTYIQPFMELTKEVQAAQVVAQQNLKMMNACTKYFDVLYDSKTLEEIVQAIPSLLHTLRLVWQNSSWYRTPRRFHRILRAVCNQLILRSQAHVTSTPENNFPPELRQQLRDVLRLCAAFRGMYLDMRESVKAVYEQQMQVKNPTSFDRKLPGKDTQKKPAKLSWPERTDASLRRFNTFVDRCNDVLDLADAVTHALYLQHIRFGGRNGLSLTAGVQQLYDDFFPAYETFVSKKLKLLDIDGDVQHFNEEFFALRLQVKTVERFISNVFKQAFDGCSTLMETLSTLQMCHVVANRKAVFVRLQSTFAAILSQSMAHYKQAVDLVDEIVSNDNATVIEKYNLLAATLERVEAPWQGVKCLPSSLLLQQPGVELSKLYKAAQLAVTSAQDNLIKSWKSQCTLSSEMLKRPILTLVRDASPLPELELNFTSKELHMLETAKFFVRMKIAIPEEAEAVVNQSDKLVAVLSKLRLILFVYNQLRNDIDEVELGLYSSGFPAVIGLMREGTVGHSASSSSIHDYLSQLTELIVHGYDTKMAIVRHARQQISLIVQSWQAQSLFVGPFLHATNGAGPLYVEGFLQKLDAMHHKVTGKLKDASTQIHALLQQCFVASLVPHTSPAWQAFVAHMHKVVFEGVTAAVLDALDTIYNSVEYRAVARRESVFDVSASDVLKVPEQAVLVVRVTLENNRVVKTPPLLPSFDAPSDVLAEIMEEYLNRTLELTSHIKSLNGTSMKDQLCTMPQVLEMKQDILHYINAIAETCDAELQILTHYELLHSADPHDMFDRFLTDRSSLTADPLVNRLSVAVTGEPLTFAMQSRKLGAAVFGRLHDLATLKLSPADNPDSLPTLEEFSSCLKVFKLCRDRLVGLPEQHHMGWLQVDLAPVSSALRAWASKWLYAFGSFILDAAVATVRQLGGYLDRTEAGISELRTTRQHVSFMKVMNFFHEVSIRQEETDSKLGPLQRTLDLLSEFEIAVPSEYLDSFHAFPERLVAMRKQLEDLKKGLAPRIAQEAERIKEQLSKFSIKLGKVHSALLSCGAFQYATAPEEAADIVLDHKCVIEELERQARDLSQLQQLTGLSIVNFDELENVKQTLSRADEVISLRGRVASSLSNVMNATWMTADLEAVQSTVQEALVMLEPLPEECLQWDVTKGFKQQLEGMLAALPLIESLRREDLRSSHWKKLFRDTEMEESLDDVTIRAWTLHDMLYWLPSDQPWLVERVVDMASRDISGEAALRQFEERWMTAVFKLQQWFPGVTTDPVQPGRGRSQRATSRRATVRMSVDGRASRVSTASSDISGAHTATQLSTPCSIVSGLDELFQMIHENRVAVVRLNAAKSSGSRVMASEISSTQARLRTINDVLFSLHDVQQLWMLLSEAFLQHSSGSAGLPRTSSVGKQGLQQLQPGPGRSSNTAAQTAQSSQPAQSAPVFERELAREIQIFLSANTDFRQLMNGVLRDPAVIGLCLKPGVPQLLVNLKQNLNHCWGALKRFYVMHSETIPRLGFLSPSDLVEVQCCCSHPLLLQRAIRIAFPSILGVDIEQRAQLYFVTGCATSTGEKFEFESPLVFKGKTSRFIEGFEAKIKSYISSQISALLQEGEADGILSPLALRPPTRQASQVGDVYGDGDGDNDGGNVAAQELSATGDPAKPTGAPSLASSTSESTPGGGAADQQPSSSHHGYSVNWMMDRLAQCTIVALMVKHTQDVEDIVTATVPGVQVTPSADEVGADLPDRDTSALLRGSTVGWFEDLLRSKAQQLVDVTALLASAHSAADRCKLTTILSVLLAQRDATECLVQVASATAGSVAAPSSAVGASPRPVSASASPSAALSFEVSSRLRYHATADKRVVVQIGETCLSYGYEPANPGSSLVFSPATERLWYNIMHATRIGFGAALIPDENSQPASTTRLLAYMLGRPYFQLECSNETRFQQIARVLSGLATMDCVVAIANPTLLSPDVFSALVERVNMLMVAVRTGRSTITVDSTLPSVRVQSYPVCTLMSTGHNAHKVVLPPAARQSFRTLTVSIPHTQAAAEALLAAQGFSTASSLARSLNCFVHLMEELDVGVWTAAGKPLACRWGLHFTSNVLRCVIARRPEPPVMPDMSEEDQVVSGILTVVGTRIRSKIHVHVLYDALRSAFGDHLDLDLFAQRGHVLQSAAEVAAMAAARGVAVAAPIGTTQHASTSGLNSISNPRDHQRSAIAATGVQSSEASATKSVDSTTSPPTSTTAGRTVAIPGTGAGDTSSSTSRDASSVADEAKPVLLTELLEEDQPELPNRSDAAATAAAAKRAGTRRLQPSVHALSGSALASQSVNDAISRALLSNNLSLANNFVGYARQLYELTRISSVVHLYGPCASGRSTCIGTVAAALRRAAGVAVTRYDVPAAAMSLSELLGDAGRDTAADTPTTSRVGLIPMLVRQGMELRDATQASAVSMTDGTSATEEHDQQLTEELWFVVEGPAPRTLVQRLEAVEALGYLELLDGTKLYMPSHIKLILVDDDDEDIERSEVCPAMYLPSLLETSIVAHKLSLWIQTQPSFAKVDKSAVQKQLELLQRFWIAHRHLDAVVAQGVLLIGLAETVMALYPQKLAACLQDVSHAPEDQLVIPCIHYCVMWASLGWIARMHKSQADAFERACEWWRQAANKVGVTFPEQANVLDCRVNPITAELQDWNDALHELLPSAGRRVGHVRTPEHAYVATARLQARQFLMQLSMQAGRTVVVVGDGASGKSQMLHEAVECHSQTSTSSSDTAVVQLCGSDRLTPPALWEAMSKQLDCPAGTTYVPSQARKQLVCVVDDADMTVLQAVRRMHQRREIERLELDAAGPYATAATVNGVGTSHVKCSNTRSAASTADPSLPAPVSSPMDPLYFTDTPENFMSQTLHFMKQIAVQQEIHTAEGHVKKVKNTTFVITGTATGDDTVVAAPFVPSFTRHCTVICLPAPTQAELTEAFTTLVNAYLTPEMLPSVCQMDDATAKISTADAAEKAHMLQRWSSTFVAAAVEFHLRASTTFIYTRDRTLYLFSMNDLKQCVLDTINRVTLCTTAEQAVLMWAAVCRVVYLHRMSSQTDVARLRVIMQNVVRKHFHADIVPRSAPLPIWVSKKCTGSFPDLSQYPSVDQGYLLYSSELLSELSPFVIAGITRTPDRVLSQANILGYLAQDINVYVEENRSRIPSYDLQLLDSQADVISSLIDCLLQYPQRPNCFLRIMQAREIIQLASSVAGYEVVFSDATATSSFAKFRAAFVELVMRAGTREESVVYAVDMAQMPEEFLSALTSYIVSGEIGDLLSPDNLVAVSTLTQPKVLAAGLQPTLRNAWQFFKNLARRHLRVILYAPDLGTAAQHHQLRLLAFNRNLCNYLQIMVGQPNAEGDLVSTAESLLRMELGKVPNYDDSVVERLSSLMVVIHQKAIVCDPEDPRDRSALNHINTHKFSVFVQEASVLLRLQWESLSGRVVRLQEGLRHTHAAENLVYRLRSERDEIQVALAEKDAITKRLLAQIGRDLAASKKLSARCVEKEQELSQLQAESAVFEQSHSSALSVSTAKIRVLFQHVTHLSADVVKGLQTLSRAPLKVENLFSAIIMLIHGTPVELDETDLSWRLGGRRLCSDASRLRASLLDIATKTIDTAVLQEVRDMLLDEGIALPEPTVLTDAQLAAAALSSPLSRADRGAQDGSQDEDCARDSMSRPGSVTMPSLTSRSPKASAYRYSATSATDGGTSDAAAAMTVGESSRQSSTASLDVDGELLPAAFPILVQWLSDCLSLHEHLNTTARPAEVEYTRHMDRIAGCETTLMSLRTKSKTIAKRVAALQTSFNTSTRIKNEHLQQVERITTELEQADAFLQTLQAEQESWRDTIAELQEESLYLESNSIMTAGIRTYLVALTGKTRQRLMDVWVDMMNERGLKVAIDDESDGEGVGEDLVQLADGDGDGDGRGSYHVHQHSAGHLSPVPGKANSAPSREQSQLNELEADPDIETDAEAEADGKGDSETESVDDGSGRGVSRRKTRRRTFGQLFKDHHERSGSHGDLQSASFDAPDAPDQSRRGSVASAMLRRQSQLLLTKPEAVHDQGEEALFDINMVLPLLCPAGDVLAGAQQGDDELLFLNRAVTALPQSWYLVDDPHGFGLEHLARCLTGQYTLSAADGCLRESQMLSAPIKDLPMPALDKQLVLVNMKFGALPLSQLVHEVESSIAAKLPCIVYNAPKKLDAGTLGMLHELYQQVDCSFVDCVGLDDTGHIKVVKPRHQLFIVGHTFDLDSWLSPTTGTLSLLSYGQLTSPSMQQYFGSAVFHWLWSEDYAAYNNLLEQAASLETGSLRLTNQLVSALADADGLPDADVVAEMVETKAKMAEQLVETHELIEEVNAKRADSETIGSCCADVVDLAFDMEKISHGYHFSVGNIVRTFLSTLSSNVSDLLATASGVAAQSTSSPTTNDASGGGDTPVLHLMPAVFQAAHVIRRELSSADVAVFDACLYLKVYVPLLRQVQEQAAEDATEDTTQHADDVSKGSSALKTPVSIPSDIYVPDQRELGFYATALAVAQEDASSTHMRSALTRLDSVLQAVHGLEPCLTAEVQKSKVWSSLEEMGKMSSVPLPDLVCLQGQLDEPVIALYKVLVACCVAPSAAPCYLTELARASFPDSARFIDPSDPIYQRRMLHTILLRRTTQKHLHLCNLPLVPHSAVSSAVQLPPCPILLRVDPEQHLTHAIHDDLRSLLTLTGFAVNGQTPEFVTANVGCMTRVQLKKLLDQWLHSNSWVVLDGCELQPELMGDVTSYARTVTLQQDRALAAISEGASSCHNTPGRLVLIFHAHTPLPQVETSCIFMTYANPSTFTATLRRLAVGFQSVVSEDVPVLARLILVALALCHSALLVRQHNCGWLSESPLSDSDLLCAAHRVLIHLGKTQEKNIDALQETLVQLVLNEYALPFSDVWNHRMLESIMGVVVGASPKDTLAQFGLEELLSGAQGVSKAHKQQQKQQEQQQHDALHSLSRPESSSTLAAAPRSPLSSAPRSTQTWQTDSSMAVKAEADATSAAEFLFKASTPKWAQAIANIDVSQALSSVLTDGAELAVAVKTARMTRDTAALARLLKAPHRRTLSLSERETARRDACTSMAKRLVQAHDQLMPRVTELLAQETALTSALSTTVATSGSTKQELGGTVRLLLVEELQASWELLHKCSHECEMLLQALTKGCLTSGRLARIIHSTSLALVPGVWISTRHPTVPPPNTTPFDAWLDGLTQQIHQLLVLLESQALTKIDMRVTRRPSCLVAALKLSAKAECAQLVASNVPLSGNVINRIPLSGLDLYAASVKNGVVTAYDPNMKPSKSGLQLELRLIGHASSNVTQPADDSSSASTLPVSDSSGNDNDGLPRMASWTTSTTTVEDLLLQAVPSSQTLTQNGAGGAEQAVYVLGRPILLSRGCSSAYTAGIVHVVCEPDAEVSLVLANAAFKLSMS
eukprot:m.161990 g.161990  ORF g.161990 m.161990 type:complete len:5864 (+) comp14370_c0_seq2:258-17849(+)